MQETACDPSSISVQVNGIDMACLQWRPARLDGGAHPADGERGVVLACHGFPDHARTFRFLGPALANQGYRVVAPNLRGYGAGQVDKGPFHPLAIARDIVELAAQLTAEQTPPSRGPTQPLFLVGHDWGAAATYLAASALGSNVEKIATLAVPPGDGFMRALVTDPEQQRMSWYMYFFQLPMAEQAVAHDDLAACGETLVRLSAGICGVWWCRCRRWRCGPSGRRCGDARRRKPLRPKGSTAWAHLWHGARSMMNTASPSRTAHHIWCPRRSNSATREFYHRLLAFVERLWSDWSPSYLLPGSEMRLLKDTLSADGVLRAALRYYRDTFQPPAPSEEIAAFAGRTGALISAPCLYLHGAEDGCIGFDCSVGMEQGFSGAVRRELLEGVGHFLHLETPDVVHSKILAFFDEGDRS